ncbi:hypothetical protein HKX48_005483 [Thoreauomyces humboldtii]|nr:hypothetical protein HKX48_005483 [Thoreauomyces humboldtii]
MIRHIPVLSDRLVGPRKRAHSDVVDPESDSNHASSGHSQRKKSGLFQSTEGGDQELSSGPGARPATLNPEMNANPARNQQFMKPFPDHSISSLSTSTSVQEETFMDLTPPDEPPYQLMTTSSVHEPGIVNLPAPNQTSQISTRLVPGPNVADLTLPDRSTSQSSATSVSELDIAGLFVPDQPVNESRIADLTARALGTISKTLETHLVDFKRCQADSNAAVFANLRKEQSDATDAWGKKLETRYAALEKDLSACHNVILERTPMRTLPSGSDESQTAGSLDVTRSEVGDETSGLLVRKQAASGSKEKFLARESMGEAKVDANLGKMEDVIDALDARVKVAESGQKRLLLRNARIRVAEEEQRSAKAQVQALHAENWRLREEHGRAQNYSTTGSPFLNTITVSTLLEHMVKLEAAIPSEGPSLLEREQDLV